MRRESLRVTAPLLAFATAAALVFSNADAAAFCRTRTVAPPADYAPSSGANGCFGEGLPVFHKNQCFAYRLLAKESPKISRAVLSNSIGRAFSAWLTPNAVCAPGISAIELAPSTATVIAEYKTNEPNENIVGVVDGPWTHDPTANSLALTTLTFKMDTGEILSADLELRSDVNWSFAPAPAADAYDLDAAVTHEVGHMLGLAHAAALNTVMEASYVPGSVGQRTLENDDMRGICAIYPDRQSRVAGSGTVPSSVCDLSNAAPSTDCGDPSISHGCTVANAPSTTRTTFAQLALAAFAAASALYLRARSRKRARVR